MNRNIKFKIFKVGDWVMLYNSKLGPHPGKLKLRYIGPYKIIQDLGQGTFKLQDMFGIEIQKPVNGFRLKKFMGNPPAIENSNRASNSNWVVLSDCDNFEKSDQGESSSAFFFMDKTQNLCHADLMSVVATRGCTQRFEGKFRRVARPNQNITRRNFEKGKSFHQRPYFPCMQQQTLCRLNELRQLLPEMVRIKTVATPIEDARAEQGVRRLSREMAIIPSKMYVESESDPDQEVVEIEEEDQGVAEIMGTMMDNFVNFKQELEDEDTQAWLQKIGLREFANLPWDMWNQNIYAKTQLEILRRTEGYLFNNVRITPQYVAEVFKLQYVEGWQLPKVSDAVMKKEFGPPSATRCDYQMKNVEAHRRSQLKWYMERVFLLMKFDYMSKESYAPLFAAESGEPISWATVLYDKIMTKIGLKDKRKAQVKSKLGPYLKAMFDAAQT